MSGVLVCLIEKPLHFAQLSQLGQDTWLILPAEICSDKRLSHACLKKSTQLNLRTDDSKSVSSEDSSTHERGNVHS